MQKTILLADDSATIRKIVELTFADTEFTVDAVKSGTEALARLEQSRPDVVLADVTMPEPGGYELCRMVKQSGKGIPVLLLAGTFDPFDDQLAERCAADGHLVKPFEAATLVRKIESLLAQPPRELSQRDPDPPRKAPTPATKKAPASAETHVVTAPPSRPAMLTDADHAAIATEVVRQLTAGENSPIRQMLRDVAEREIISVAERVVRERIRELETEPESR